MDTQEILLSEKETEHKKTVGIRMYIFLIFIQIHKQLLIHHVDALSIFKFEFQSNFTKILYVSILPWCWNLFQWNLISTVERMNSSSILKSKHIQNNRFAPTMTIHYQSLFIHVNKLFTKTDLEFLNDRNE